jgi:hypothetical protein
VGCWTGLIWLSIGTSGSAGIAQAIQRLGYDLEDPGFESVQEKNNFLFSKTPRPAVGPIYVLYRRLSSRQLICRSLKLTTFRIKFQG